MKKGQVPLSHKAVRAHLNRSAQTYDQAAVLPNEVADRLLNRLVFMKIKPRRILDCGAGTGYLTEKLRVVYPDAEIVAVDLSEKRLGLHGVCVDYKSLPFAEASFDMIVSHFALLCIPLNRIEGVFLEWYRLLGPNGLVLFSTVGPDTLKELRATYQQLNQAPPLHDMLDMHDIGDQLLGQGFEDPVVDMECLTLHYGTVIGLFRELQALGATNARVDRFDGLMGKDRWQRIMATYLAQWSLPNGKIPATVEVIYGQAWKPDRIASEMESREVCISVESLMRTIAC